MRHLDPLQRLIEARRWKAVQLRLVAAWIWTRLRGRATRPAAAAGMGGPTRAPS